MGVKRRLILRVLANIVVGVTAIMSVSVSNDIEILVGVSNKRINVSNGFKRYSQLNSRAP